MSSCIYKSASTLAHMILNREISAVEVVKAHLDRIEAVNHRLNAVVQIAPERALAEAETADRAVAREARVGPLHGVPVTIKDSLDTAGIITTWGTAGRKSFVPDSDAPVVARLREAGAIVLGKTNTPELTLGGAMTNEIYGPSVNPYDCTKSPGGSSGGAAAILAAGGSALDLGSDTGGSIRSPAHVCGIAGIKPTYGRAPRSGHAVPWGLGAADRLTQIGPMARCVADLRLALPLICGPDGLDPSVVPMPMEDPEQVGLDQIRIAYYTGAGLPAPDETIGATVKRIAGLLADAGVRIEAAAPEGLDRAGWLFPGLQHDGGAAWIRRLLDRAGTPRPGPQLTEQLRFADKADTPALGYILEEVDRYCSDLLQFMQTYDAILCPVDIAPALSHDPALIDHGCKTWGHMTAYNLTGWPAGVVRAGETAQGLPIGVQVVSRPWREDIVLAVLEMIESLGGGFQPPRALDDCLA